MAKKSVAARNKKRILLSKKFEDRRSVLKAVIMDRSSSLESSERTRLSAELSALPRDSSKTRVRNRCFVTQRARGFYSYFGLSRLSLRQMASFGLLPGVKKKSL